MIASASDLPIGFFDQPTSYRWPRTVVLRSEMKTKGKRIVFLNVIVKKGKERCLVKDKRKYLKKKRRFGIMIKRYHNCYIWFLNLIKAGFFKLLVQSTSAVLKQYIESVFRVCIAWYKHERGWKNSWQLCKPETKSRVWITSRILPTPPVLISDYANTGKKFSIAFINQLPREKTLCYGTD